MKVERSRRPYLARSLALLLSVAGGLLAALEAVRVWSALASGQAKFFALVGIPALFSRSDDPVMFHAALLCSMLIAVLCVYAAQRAWRYRRATLPSPGR